MNHVTTLGRRRIKQHSRKSASHKDATGTAPILPRGSFWQVGFIVIFPLTGRTVQRYLLYLPDLKDGTDDAYDEATRTLLLTMITPWSLHLYAFARCVKCGNNKVSFHALRGASRSQTYTRSRSQLQFLHISSSTIVSSPVASLSSLLDIHHWEMN